MSGFLVSFEGTEGCGKSTQVRLLAAALRARGRRVRETREPGDSSLGESLRAFLLAPRSPAPPPEAELFLYLADRALHVREVVAPALGAGEVVLCDRFTDATLAYQGYGRGLDRRMIRGCNAAAAGGARPDLTFLLDLPVVETGLARARRRGRQDGSAGVADRFEREEADFHRRVRRGYLELAAAEPRRFVVLSAERAPEQLHGVILETVLARLALRAVAEG